jgi:hypothetical protein
MYILYILTTDITTDNSDTRQSRPLVREGAPQGQDRSSQNVPNIWSWAPDGARHQDGLDWLTVWLGITQAPIGASFLGGKAVET